SHARPSRLSRDDGKLFRSEGEIVRATPATAEKEETGRRHQHRRPIWPAIARKERQESLSSDFRNGITRRFSRFKLSNGICRYVLPARCARQKLSRSGAANRPFQRREFAGRACRRPCPRRRFARSCSQSRQIATSSRSARDSSGETAVPGLCRLRAHAGYASECPKDFA